MKEKTKKARISQDGDALIIDILGKGNKVEQTIVFPNPEIEIVSPKPNTDDEILNFTIIAKKPE